MAAVEENKGTPVDVKVYLRYFLIFSLEEMKLPSLTAQAKNATHCYS